MCARVCLYVCEHVHVCARVTAHVWGCACFHVFACVYIRVLRECLHVFEHARVCVCVAAHAYIRACMLACLRMCVSMHVRVCVVSARVFACVCISPVCEHSHVCTCAPAAHIATHSPAAQPSAPHSDVTGSSRVLGLGWDRCSGKRSASAHTAVAECPRVGPWSQEGWAWSGRSRHTLLHSTEHRRAARGRVVLCCAQLRF